jgi:urea transporter
MQMDLLVNGIPRGAGQVVFQNNPWKGLLVLVAIGVYNPLQFTLLGLLGLVTGTLFGSYLRVNWGSICNGCAHTRFTRT